LNFFVLCASIHEQFQALLKLTNITKFWKCNGVEQQPEEDIATPPMTPPKPAHHPAFVPAGAAGGSPTPKRAAPYAGPQGSPTKKAQPSGQGNPINVYIDQNLRINANGELMEPGVPLSDQHGCSTWKDHLASGKTLFNTSLNCKWHPQGQDGAIGHWRTDPCTNIIRHDLLKYLAPEELARVKQAVEAVGSHQEKMDYQHFEAWIATHD